MTCSNYSIGQTDSIENTHSNPDACNWGFKLSNEYNETCIQEDQYEIIKPSDNDENHCEEDNGEDCTGDNGGDCGQDNAENGSRLSFDDVRNLINAHAFARSLGHDLTASVTIRLDRSTTFQPADWTTWQGRFLDKLTRWLGRHGIPPAFLWVKEAGRHNGAHLHLLLHLSDYVRQRDPLEAFIRWTGEFAPDDETPGNRAVVVSGGKFGMHTATMQAGSLIYLLKTLDPTAERLGQNIANALGIRPHRNAQRITGRLHHASQSIGPTARKTGGWQDMRDLQHLRFYLHP